MRDIPRIYYCPHCHKFYEMNYGVEQVSHIDHGDEVRLAGQYCSNCDNIHQLNK
jgi:hypothetical protein